MISVEKRQHNIDQYQMRIALGKSRKHILEVLHAYHFVAPGLNLFFHRFCKRKIIFYNQDAVHRIVSFLFVMG